MSMKNPNDTIRNRIRDTPSCNAVPQPTSPPSDPTEMSTRNISWAVCQCHSLPTSPPQLLTHPRQGRMFLTGTELWSAQSVALLPSVVSLRRESAPCTANCDNVAVTIHLQVAPDANTATFNPLASCTLEPDLG